MARLIDWIVISIHAPRMGSDCGAGCRKLSHEGFQSTLPAWGATRKILRLLQRRWLFQSTLPAWGATVYFLLSSTCVDISIHAPRMGSDGGSSISFGDIHVFQSTLPAWGATFICCQKRRKRIFQSTLPAWGATFPARGVVVRF